MDHPSSVSNSLTRVFPKFASSKLNERFSNFPDEIKTSPHWFPCGPPLKQQGVETRKAPLTLNGEYRATWGTESVHNNFPVALEAVAALNAEHGEAFQYLAYALTDADPFTCIDFDPVCRGDLKKDGTAYEPEEWTPKADFDFINWLVNNHDTYAEMSGGGQGVHIWVRGNIMPDERKRTVITKRIEVYSQNHIIVCTGHSIGAINYQLDKNQNLTTNETRTDERLPVMEGQGVIEQTVLFFDLERGLKNSKPKSETKLDPMPTSFVPLIDEQTLKSFEDYDVRFVRWIMDRKNAGRKFRNIYLNNYFPDDIVGDDKSPSAARASCLYSLAKFSRGDRLLVERCFMHSSLFYTEAFQERLRQTPNFLQDEINGAFEKVNANEKGGIMEEPKNNVASINQQGQSFLESLEPKRRVLFQSMDDIFLKPAPVWLIKNLIPEKGLAVMYGPPASGKTFTAFDMLGSIAMGRPFFGMKTKQRKVCYLYFEDSTGIPVRTRAYVQHHIQTQIDGVDSGQELNTFKENFCFVEAIGADLMSGDITDLLEILRAKVGTESVVCVDTLSSSAPSMDENSSEGMGQMLKALHTIESELNCLVLAIHHTGKDEDKGARGHSSLRGNVDASIRVEPAHKGHKQWFSDKVKNQAASPVNKFYLESVQVGIDSDGDPITSCVVKPVYDTVNPYNQQHIKDTMETVKNWIADAIIKKKKTSHRALETIHRELEPKFTQVDMRTARDNLITNGTFLVVGEGGSTTLGFGPNYDGKIKPENKNEIKTEPEKVATVDMPEWENDSKEITAKKTTKKKTTAKKRAAKKSGHK